MSARAAIPRARALVGGGVGLLREPVGADEAAEHDAVAHSSRGFDGDEVGGDSDPARKAVRADDAMAGAASGGHPAQRLVGRARPQEPLDAIAWRVTSRYQSDLDPSAR